MGWGMNKRSWQRRNMSLDVEVRLWRRQGEQVINCKTRNVCMTGTYISTTELGFPKRRLVELRFTILDRLRLKHPEILARVVHKGKDGLGLRFCKTDSATIRALHRMLQWRNYYPLPANNVPET